VSFLLLGPPARGEHSAAEGFYDFLMDLTSFADLETRFEMKVYGEAPDFLHKSP